VTAPQVTDPVKVYGEGDTAARVLDEIKWLGA
jgi:hypothetical protein